VDWIGVGFDEFVLLWLVSRGSGLWAELEFCGCDDVICRHGARWNRKGEGVATVRDGGMGTRQRQWVRGEDFMVNWFFWFGLGKATGWRIDGGGGFGWVCGSEMVVWWW
jgi:hypothetical protein